MKKYIKYVMLLFIIVILSGCNSNKNTNSKVPKDIMLGYSFQKKIGTENVNKVINISTSNKLELDNYAFVYDISAAKNGSVKAYLIDNKEYPGYYDLVLAADNGIVANQNSDFLFRDFVNTISIDLTYLYTDNAISMRGMFYNCKKLQTVNLKNFNTSKVTNMMSMFRNCNTLQSLDLSNFDTSNVKDMSYMFYGLYYIKELDLSNFDTSKVTTMSYMFADNVSLANVNVTSFNTSNVSDVSNMFYRDKSLVSLDFSSFNTSNMTNYIQMVHGCTKLTTITITKNKWTIVLNYSKDMKKINVIVK